MTTVKIAALQMVSTPDVAENLASAVRLVAEAAAAGAELVALPEYFCLLGRRDTDKLAVAEAPGDGPIQRFLADAAKRHGVFIIGGTLPVRAPASGPREGSDAAPHVLNRCCFFTPAGAEAGHYDKIHLFAFDNGRENYDEGRTLAAGSDPVATSLALPGWGAPEQRPLRLGLSVCYDLRFPELYRALMHPPCDLIAVPSAFTHTTGLAHWEVLLRARAIETGAFVIAPAQGGVHEDGRTTYGHSLIVNPWGEVIAKLDHDEPGMLVADLDLDEVAAARAKIPAWQGPRPFTAPRVTAPKLKTNA